MAHRYNTIPFGIAVLDERLGGAVQGGVHAFVGGPGTGKTVAALQFLKAGLRHGGRVAQLTQARPEDLIGLARSIGIDPEPYLESGDWVLLGYQPGFRERYRRALEPGEVFEELRGLVDAEEGRPERLVIDTCGPLVESREAGNGAEHLVELLDELGATTLLTFAGAGIDALGSGMETISQRASLIADLTLNETGRREFVLRKTPRPLERSGPISFEIREAAGIVPRRSGTGQRAGDLAPEARRRVLLLDLAGALPEEVRGWLDGAYELTDLVDPVDAFPELARREFGLVIVHLDRRSVQRGLHVMQQVRRAASGPPILVLCNYDLRASDRARALRTGADDFISGGVHADELESRIEALLRRGRGEAAGPQMEEPEPRPEPLRTAPGRVSELVRSLLDADRAPIFSLVLLRPRRGPDVDELASHVADRMRQGTGDHLSVERDRVEVYLHGALANHARRFLKRVRTSDWEDVDYEVYTSPTDRRQLLEVIRNPDG